MCTSRHSREVSSEASLWDDLDDTEQALANLATPSLHVQTLPTSSAAQRRVASPPPAGSCAKLLELQLFPSIETEQNRAPLTPASSHINGADMGNPWSQIGVNSTQFMREEWLASAAHTKSTRLNEQNGARLQPAAGTTSKFFTPTKPASTPARPASSLLDQLDEICGPSPSVAKTLTSSASTSFAKPATAHAPLASPRNKKTALPSEACQTDDNPDRRLDLGAEASFLEMELAPKRTLASHTALETSEQEELTAIDILNMSCSPPSQLIPHITLIKDMPEEQQQIYHRLAFSSSSGRASQASTRSVTARGTKGKIWKNTWQHDESGGTASAGASTTRRRPPVASHNPRATGFKRWPLRRGRKPKGGRT